MPVVLLAKTLLSHPRDETLLDYFLDVAFAMSAELGTPVRVQEIEGQLACFHCPPVWAHEEPDYVTLLQPVRQEAA